MEANGAVAVRADLAQAALISYSEAARWPVSAWVRAAGVAFERVVELSFPLRRVFPRLLLYGPLHFDTSCCVADGEGAEFIGL